MRLFLALTLLLSSGCTAMRIEGNLRDNLANRGPVSLSRSNPYIASNILLSKEVELNSTLKGFLKVRGNPDAIEVKKVLLRPYIIYFFYAEPREVFILEEANGDWIIRGPQTIPEPVLEVLEKILPNTTSGSLASGESSDRQGIELESSLLEAGNPSDIPEEGAELLDTKSAKTPLPSADTAEGDILHKIQFKGETLRLISEWYTGSADNAGRIARINGLDNANTLALGQTIRIPRYLIKNSQPLSQDRVDAYRKAHR